ncbi:hypothetical protein Q1W73_05550 [Asticcacaulis sp. ZE23SCel15]|uniref:hypothetical protein n=1 Tax=Asticcacaulis sp. ZE23SCel15 TaxID=3059027 RepID=UPI00265E5D67|nr:hypothetical protein [Asticcacaulis sp. ZE23SCel15]WKL58451.1 hypothetical protein Q1W73_05550 [Asticcacaulis sp. ZE23SCel15]
MSTSIRTIIAASLLSALLTVPSLAEPIARPNVSGFDTVMVGGTRVTALYKGYVSGVHRDQVAHAYARLISANMTSPSPLAPQIAAFVVDDGDKVTLVCLEGREPAPAERGYVMSHLVAAGYAPEDIDEIRVAGKDDAAL